MHDVFISFSSQNQDQAEYIVNQLTNVYHISCWISFRKIGGGQEFDDKIAEAIENASIVVFVQSKESLLSRYVHDEVNYALDMNKIIIPFRIDNSELEKGLKMRLRGKERIDATVPTFDERIEDLARSIQQNITPTFPSETRTLASILPDQAPHFMGRDQEIEQIHEELSKHNKLFLQGFGGIGKSELAVAYAHRYREEYDTVVFAGYETSLRMLLNDDDKFAIDRFSRSTGESDEEYFEHKLKTLRQITTPRTLIIIDNFDVDTDPDLDILLDGKYTLLFTTRNEHDDSSQIPTLHVHEMSEEMQLALFREHCKIFRSEKDTAEIKKILKLIGGHTLTIELVAKLMEIKRIQSPKMILAQLQEGHLAALSGKVKYKNQAKNTVYAFVHQLFNLSALNEEELQILMDLSLMPLDGVGFDEYLDWSGQEDAENVYNLIESGWILAKDIDENGTTQTIALHPLIAEVVEEECKPDLDKCHVMFERMIGKLDRYKFRGMDYKTISMYSTILRSICHKCPYPTPRNTYAYDTILDILCDTGFYELGINLGLKTLKANIDNFSEYSAPVAINYYFLAAIYISINDQEKAFFYLKKSLLSFRSAKQQTIDYAYVVKCYADQLIKMDGWWNAEHGDNKPKDHVNLILEALNESKRVFENTPEEYGVIASGRLPFQASLYHITARYYILVGELDTAIEYEKKSCASFRESHLPEDRFWVMAPLGGLAIAYAKKGNAAEAVEYANQALKICMDNYSETHPKTLRQWMYIANVYRILQDKENEMKALLHIKEVSEKEAPEKGGQFSMLYHEVVERIKNLQAVCAADDNA